MKSGSAWTCQRPPQTSTSMTTNTGSFGHTSRMWPCFVVAPGRRAAGAILSAGAEATVPGRGDRRECHSPSGDHQLPVLITLTTSHGQTGM
eukprot:scaffold54172_cov32-Prasinocladus_malaysianus.AAC.1